MAHSVVITVPNGAVRAACVEIDSRQITTKKSSNLIIATVHIVFYEQNVHVTDMQYRVDHLLGLAK